LQGIRAYLALRNPEAAREVIATIRKEISLLAEQPSIGRPGRIADTRELVTRPYPYIVAYRQRVDEIHVLAVIHTSRRWPENGRSS